MQQHLGRQAGVQKVNVSLIDGKVDITPKTDDQIDPIKLMEATYDSGVSVAEMTMIAQGQITRNDAGQLVFQAGPKHSFVVAKDEKSAELESLAGSNTQVTVRALLFEKPAGQKKQALPKALSISILEIQRNK